MMYTIKELRARKKMSQEELAKKVNVSSMSIKNYEKKVNKPKVDIAIRIAKALEVNTEDIEWS